MKPIADERHDHPLHLPHTDLASMPPSETMNLPAARLISIALGVGRRAARSIALIPEGDSSSACRGQEKVRLHREWQQFRAGRVEFRARVAMPPLLAVHKPRGVVVSRREDGSDQPTLWEALAHVPHAADLQAVGRLDAESEGLLLMTGDGKLLHGLTRPSSAVRRRYLAWLDARPDPERIAQLRAGGLSLRDGHRPDPVLLERVDPALPCEGAVECWEMILTEGKYHEVRRAFAACDSRVVRLLRTSFGPVELSDDLMTPGTWRRLRGDILASTYAAAGIEMIADAVEVERLERSRED